MHPAAMVALANWFYCRELRVFYTYHCRFAEATILSLIQDEHVWAYFDRLTDPKLMNSELKVDKKAWECAEQYLVTHPAAYI